MSSYIVPPCKAPLTELFRDAHLVVTHKPSGLLSVPGRPPNDRDSALGRLQRINPETRVVHRLDMSTSGLMVFGIGADSHRHLSRQFQDRVVTKEYVAETWGVPENAQGEITLPLRCDWPNRPRQRVDHALGKAALTRYRRLPSSTAYGRVSLIPVTGRSHQLRVHLAELGHPVIGCEFYASEAARKAAPRLHLHACKLGFYHPVSHEFMHFNSPAPF